MSLYDTATVGDVWCGKCHTFGHDCLSSSAWARFPQWTMVSCDHCYCEAAAKRYHRKCCKCADERHKRFIT